MNLNITIMNENMIKSTHDRWNHRNGFGRRGPVFEVSCWRLAVPFSWCTSWFIATKGISLIHIYSKTWWEEVRSTDNTGIILVSNYSTAFENNLLSNVESCNNFLESCCIIFGGRWRTKMTRELTWRDQCSWCSNSLQITIDSINIYSCVDT